MFADMDFKDGNNYWEVCVRACVRPCVCVCARACFYLP